MLVSTIDILKSHIATIVSENFDKYKSYIDDANIWIRRELLGGDIYATIKDLASTDETHGDLVKRAERVVAHKGYLDAVPFMDLVETDSGFAVMQTQTKAPASKERVQKLVAGLERKLTDAIEELLEYLEETIAYHDDWKGSPAYTLLSDTFIHTLKEFNRYANFEGSRFDFKKAKPTMLNVINTIIAPVISIDLCDEIIEQIRDNDLSDNNKSILENLKYAYAWFSVGDDTTAKPYLQRVRKVITATPENYPAYLNSDLYASTQAAIAAEEEAAINDKQTLFRTAL